MRTCVQRLSQFSANAMANMVKSLSTVETDVPSLYMAIVEESLQRLPQLQPPALCNTLQGLTMADACSTYEDHRVVISTAVSRVCQHLSTRIDELKQGEFQQISAAVHEHSVSNLAAQALDRILKEHANHKALPSTTSDSGEQSHFTRQNSEDDDLLWPTNTTSSLDGDSAASTTDSAGAWDCPTTSVFPVQLGNTLASLANGPATKTKNPASKLSLEDQLSTNPLGKPSYIAQSPGPVYNLDLEPWKVEVPSYPPCGHSPISCDPSTAEAFLQASFYAMMAAASISGTVAAAEKNGQSQCPARVPVGSSSPPLATSNPWG